MEDENYALAIARGSSVLIETFGLSAGNPSVPLTFADLQLNSTCVTVVGAKNSLRFVVDGC